MNEQLKGTKLAAFEDFKFKIGDFVRLRAARIEAEQAIRMPFDLARKLSVGENTISGTVNGSTPVAMVIHRKVVQGANDVWNYYYVKGGTWADNVWEDELELVSSD